MSQSPKERTGFQGFCPTRIGDVIPPHGYAILVLDGFWWLCQQHVPDGFGGFYRDDGVGLHCTALHSAMIYGNILEGSSFPLTDMPQWAIR